MYEILAAFLVGLASFFSPCVLPIAPGFISALAGTVTSASESPVHKEIQDIFKAQVSEYKERQDISRSRKVMFLSTGYFVLGFALTFALLGTIIACFCTSNSLLGLQLKHILAWAGGFVMLGLGIYMILSTKIARLNYQKMISFERVKGLNIHTAYITSFIFGITFAAGWTPCVGPLLASILTQAVEHPEIAYNELLVYAFGLGVPFLIISLFISESKRFIKKVVKSTRFFDYIMGVALIIIGIWFLYQQITDPVYFLPKI